MGCMLTFGALYVCFRCSLFGIIKDDDVDDKNIPICI